ncbi:MAG: glycine cleavage system protein GcvH [Candidatus Coatesbacteria bacterium]|nr:MAG: glycine cleavage system protein GcvH [Candidatus Coatesbacteria bacterium]
MIPEHLRYVSTHEWLDPKTGKVGITDPAQEQLGDMVFVEFPEVGSEFAKGERFGSVESVKSVSDCYLPVSGKVVAINEDLLEAPEILNQDPYEKGWLIKIEIKNPAEIDELMSAADYDKFVKEEAGEH